MADQTVTLRITANTQGLVTGVEMAKRETRSLGEEGQAAGRNLGGGIAAARAEIERTGSLINQVKGFVGGLAAAFVSVQSVRAVASMADEWSDLTSLVRVNIGATEDASAVMERLTQVARGTYSSLRDTAQSFAANASTLNALGKSTQEQLDYTTALNNALVISGAKGEQFAQVQDALSKAMATGTLRGEEFNTVMARGSAVADALAEELGTNVLELRKMAADGKITGDVIFTALVRRMKELEETAESMPATMSDAIVVMRNSLLSLVGYADDASGATGGIADAVIDLADVLGRPEVKEGFAAIALGAVNAAAEVAKLFGEVAALADFAGRLAAMKVTGWVDPDDLEIQQRRVAELTESIRRWEATQADVTGKVMEFFGSDISGRIAEMEKEKQALLKNMGEVSAQRLVLNQQLRDAEAAAKAAAEAAGKQRTAELNAAAAAAKAAAESEEAKRKAATEAKKLEQQRARLIEQAGRYLASLEKEVATFGMTEDAVRRYELAHTEGLTPAQREQAEAALDQIEANRQLKDVWDETTRAAESLARGNDDLRERIAQQEDVLRGLTPAQVALNAANREAAVLEAQLALGKEGLTDAMRGELQARLDLIQAYASNEVAIEAQKNLADQASETGRMMRDEIRSFSQAAAEGTERVGDYFSNLWRRIKASLIQSGLTSLLGSLFGAMGGAGGGWTSMLGGLMGGGSGGGFGSGFLGQLGGMFGTSAMGAAGRSFGAGIGQAVPWLAAAGGALHGYRNSGIGAAVGYGVGGYAVGTVAAYGLAGAAGAAGMGGAAMASGAAGGAMMGAAAVPVIGWIIAAIAALDMLTGGKVFGTKYRPESTSQTLGIGADGAYAEAERTDVRQRSLFRGRRWNTYAIDAGDDARASADALYSSIFDAMTSAARSLAIDVPPVIDAAIRTVTEYDKKGRITGLKIFTDALGRTWEEAISDPEDEAEIQAAAARAASRIQSEAIIAVIDAALGTTIQRGVGGTSPGGPGPGLGGGGRGPGRSIEDMLAPLGLGDVVTLDPILGPIADEIEDGARRIGEAFSIAERWRHDVELLAEGAAFLLLAASDIRAGVGLLGDVGTLTQITDLIEDLAVSGETLSDTYTRVATSAALLDQALSLSGVQIDGTREHIVRLATAITDAAGGLEAAQALWQSYFANFYDAAELAQYNAEQLRTAAAAAFAGADLDLSQYMDAGGMARFRAAFEAAMPTLSAEDIAAWLRAADALAAVTASARAIDAALDENERQLHLDGLDENARAAAELAAYYDDMRASMIASAATTEQLARLEDQRALAMGRLLAAQAEQAAREQAEAEADYQSQMRAVRDELDAGRMSEFALSIRDIARWAQETTENLNTAALAAGRQGVAEEDLAAVHQVAANRATQAIAQLRSAAASVVGRLFGPAEGSLDAINTRISQIEANSTASFDSVSSGIDNAVGTWLSGIARVQDFLDSILLDKNLTTLTPEQQLAEARAQFDAMLAAARGGDADALSSLPDAARSLLDIARSFHSSGDAYTSIFDSVRAGLQGVTGLAGPTPGVTGGPLNYNAGNVASEELAALYADRDALLAAQEAAHRAELMDQLGGMVRELIAATGDPLEAVAASIGLNMRDLAAELGINLNSLSLETASSLVGLAQSLGVDVAELASNVGLSLGGLADRQSLLNQALDATLASVPDDIRAQLLAPLDAIRNATDAADANAAIADAEAAILAMPADIRNLLAPFFAGIDPTPVVTQLTALAGIDATSRAQLDAALTANALLTRIADNAMAANAAAEIPAYAAGGWVNGPTKLLAGEAGRELILPNPVSEFFQRAGIPINTSGGGTDSGLVRELIAEVRQLRAEVRQGDRDVAAAAAGAGEKVASRIDRQTDSDDRRQRELIATLPRGGA